MTDVEAPSRRRPTARLAVAYVLAEAVVLIALIGPLIGQPWWSGFRRYFSNDQLSYAGIAANVAGGNASLVEPFTLTGSLFYPSLWYQLIGAVARVTTVPVHVVWTVLGLAVVSAAVLSAGWLAHRLSGAALAPVLPALALLTGVLAAPTVDYWYAGLGVHAVVWGPYGTLFTLNAEAAGLSLLIIAMVLLVWAAWSPSAPARRRAASVLIAAALIGLLAGVQTYSFFTGVTLSLLFVACRSLLVSRSQPRTWATVGLLTTALIVGGLLTDVVGPFPILGLVLLSLTPALWPVVRARPLLALAAVAVAALASAPQIVRTLSGLAADDPFLTYRQDSTDNLGVLYSATAFATLPLLLVCAVCAVALWRRGQPTLAGLLIAVLAGLGIMSTNDLWGFHQEPYRFWLQYTILGLVLLAPVLAWSLTQLSSLARPRRIALFSVAAVAALTWAVSLADFAGFWAFARDEGVISMSDERLDAARLILADSSGIVMSSRCLDPQVLKQVTRGPVAHYNKGLAWPADVEAFEIFKDVERRAGEDPVALRAAGVGVVLTDSACADDWAFPATQEVLPLREQEYVMDGQAQSLRLWLVAPA